MTNNVDEIYVFEWMVMFVTVILGNLAIAHSVGIMQQKLIQL